MPHAARRGLASELWYRVVAMCGETVVRLHSVCWAYAGLGGGGTRVRRGRSCSGEIDVRVLVQSAWRRMLGARGELRYFAEAWRWCVAVLAEWRSGSASKEVCRHPRLRKSRYDVDRCVTVCGRCENFDEFCGDAIVVGGRTVRRSARRVHAVWCVSVSVDMGRGLDLRGPII